MIFQHILLYKKFFVLFFSLEFRHILFIIFGLLLTCVRCWKVIEVTNAIPTKTAQYFNKFSNDFEKLDVSVVFAVEISRTVKHNKHSLFIHLCIITSSQLLMCSCYCCGRYQTKKWREKKERKRKWKIARDRWKLNESIFFLCELWHRYKPFIFWSK